MAAGGNGFGFIRTRIAHVLLCFALNLLSSPKEHKVLSFRTENSSERKKRDGKSKRIRIGSWCYAAAMAMEATNTLCGNDLRHSFVRIRFRPFVGVVSAHTFSKCGHQSHITNSILSLSVLIYVYSCSPFLYSPSFAFDFSKWHRPFVLNSISAADGVNLLPIVDTNPHSVCVSVSTLNLRNYRVDSFICGGGAANFTMSSGHANSISYNLCACWTLGIFGPKTAESRDRENEK